MRLVIFDIDGTLTQTMKADGECFVRSLVEVCGFSDVHTSAFIPPRTASIPRFYDGTDRTATNLRCLTRRATQISPDDRTPLQFVICQGAHSCPFLVTECARAHSVTSIRLAHLGRSQDIPVHEP